jgi:outer membrane biosynthesis protein TonB
VQTTPARAIRRVQPLLAPNIRALLRGDTEVSVRLLVNANGNVVKVEPFGPMDGLPRVLLPPAMAAARQWRFEPARTPGGPVPSEFVVKFQFSRNR